MTFASFGPEEGSENSAQQGDILRLYSLRSVSSRVAGFAALLVGANETPNPSDC